MRIKEMVSAVELSAWIGISERRIRELNSLGVLPKAGHRYDLKETIRRYTLHLREQAAARSGIDSATDVAGASVRYRSASAQLLELRYQKERGELYEKTEIKETWFNIARQISRTVTILLPRALQDALGLSNEQRVVVDQICRDMMMDARIDDVALGMLPPDGG